MADSEAPRGKEEEERAGGGGGEFPQWFRSTDTSSSMFTNCHCYETRFPLLKLFNSTREH